MPWTNRAGCGYPRQASRQNRKRTFRQRAKSARRLSSHCPRPRRRDWICERLHVEKYSEESGLQSVGTISVSSAGRDEAIPFEDRSGRLWVGTSESGLFRLSGSGFENVSTPQPRIFALTDDREGNVWAATVAGLDCIQPRAIALDGAESGLLFGTVNSVCEDSAGQIWASTADGKIVRRQEGRWTAVTIDLPDVPQCIAADPSGGIWIGARTGGRLFHWRDDKVTVPDLGTGPAIGTIRALLVCRNGDLWFGSTGPDRLRRLRDGKTTDFALPTSINYLDSLAEDIEGNIWAGAENGGLIRIDLSDHLNDETAHAGQLAIRCLYAMSDNSLWIGSGGGGLARLKTGRLNIVSSRQGLYDDTISQIVADDRGWLWLGGDRGIFRVRQHELEEAMDGKVTRVQSFHYGVDQELPRLHARRSASPTAIRSGDGRLWMPMETALAIVRPEQVHEQSLPPTVNIKQHPR